MTNFRRTTPVLLAALAFAPVMQRPAHAQEAATPTVHEACYVPATGTVYRIKQQGLLQACRAGHVPFSWTEDAGALRAGTAAGGDLVGALPNAAVAGLRGRPVSAAAPTDGQVYAFDAATSTWVPRTPSSGVSDHGAMSGLADDDHPQYLVANGARDAQGGFAVTGTYGSGTLSVNGAGTRMLWYPRKASFRSGRALGTEWDDAQIGTYSTAMGYATTASGTSSFAMGHTATASGLTSFAVGSNTRATGPSSFAANSFTQATGDQSAAFGATTTASGESAFAIGLGTNAAGARSFAGGTSTQANGTTSMAFGYKAVAGGDHSFAFGYGANTASYGGSMVIADASTATTLSATASNTWTSRFHGGYRLFTNNLLTAGVSLAPGAGSWASMSDVNRKLDFRAVDGEDILRRLSEMPVTTWQYRAQDASIRHIGPTAQDFHRAFGVGESDTTITGVDADGVALAAVKALEQRTRELRDENAQLREEIAALRQSILELRDVRRER